VIAAPLTRTTRGIPTELPLGPDDGVPTDCAASFDNIRVIPKDHLTERVCILDPLRMLEACAALRTAVDC
jgi:mRNA interferase MazF